ncbi:MAG: putative membrane protein [Gammaproteobacteria bacterium]|jgi:uncharacterized membrane protein
MPTLQKVSIAIISSFFLIGGIGHFVVPQFFIDIVPPYLPYPEALVYISGVFEILGALGLFLPQTRQWAGYGLIALSVCVFPANIHMAMNPALFPEQSAFALQFVRPPIQLVLIWLCWVASRPTPMAAAK